MKKEYVSPSVIVEMFTVDTVILEASWTEKPDTEKYPEEDSENGDRVQIRRNQGSYGASPTFRDKGFGSLW